MMCINTYSLVKRVCVGNGLYILSACDLEVIGGGSNFLVNETLLRLEIKQLKGNETLIDVKPFHLYLY